MSGPYVYSYLIPEIRIPLEKPLYERSLFVRSATDWLNEHYEPIDSIMKNPYTGAECFSDNASVVSALLTISEIEKYDGLEQLAIDSIDGTSLDCSNWEQLFDLDENGNSFLCLDSQYRPDSWIAPEKLQAAAERAKDMLLGGDSRMIELVKNRIDFVVRDIDLNEFLPPGEAIPEEEYDESLFIEDEGELDDRSAALIGAGGYATLAIEAGNLKAGGAEKIAILSATEGIYFASSPPISPNGRALNAEQAAKQTAEYERDRYRPRRSWLSRLFGR